MHHTDKMFQITDADFSEMYFKLCTNFRYYEPFLRKIMPLK